MRYVLALVAVLAAIHIDYRITSARFAPAKGRAS